MKTAQIIVCDVMWNEKNGRASGLILPVFHPGCAACLLAATVFAVFFLATGFFAGAFFAVVLVVFFAATTPKSLFN